MVTSRVRLDGAWRRSSRCNDRRVALFLDYGVIATFNTPSR